MTLFPVMKLGLPQRCETYSPLRLNFNKEARSSSDLGGLFSVVTDCSNDWIDTMEPLGAEITKMEGLTSVRVMNEMRREVRMIRSNVGLYRGRELVPNMDGLNGFRLSLLS